jgi:predicted phage gp36 major capsid-like protein
MTVELVPHLFATGANRPSGSRGLFAYWRVGAAVINAAAARFLQIKA